MSLDNVEDSIKVIVVGDGNVGKTSMLRRFVRGEFTDQYKKTIGAEFMEKDVFVQQIGQTIRLMLWDTAGQEVFNALTASYYRGAGAAVLAFSTIDRDSFANVEKWKQKVEAQCGPITMLLCQTKFDLMNEAAVSNQEAEALAIRLKLPFFRVSTKDNFNVSQLFEFVAQASLQAGAGVDGGVDTLHSHATQVATGTEAAQPASTPAAAAAPEASATTKEDSKKDKKDKKDKDKDKEEDAPKPVNMKEPKKKKDKKDKKPLCFLS